MLCPSCQRILGDNEKQNGKCGVCQCKFSGSGISNCRSESREGDFSEVTNKTIYTSFVLLLGIIFVFVLLGLALKVAMLCLTNVKEQQQLIRLTILLGIILDVAIVFLLFTKSRFFAPFLASVVAMRFILGIATIAGPAKGYGLKTFETWSSNGPTNFMIIYLAFWLPACLYMLRSKTSKQFFRVASSSVPSRIQRAK